MGTASEARPDTKEGGGRGGHRGDIVAGVAGAGRRKKVWNQPRLQRNNRKKYQGRNQS